MVYAWKVVQFRTLPHLTTSKAAKGLAPFRRKTYTNLHQQERSDFQELTGLQKTSTAQRENAGDQDFSANWAADTECAILPR